MHVFKQTIFPLFIIICSIVSTRVWADELSDTQKMLNNLDESHQKFAQHFYRALLKKPTYKNDKYPSIAALQAQLKNHQPIKNSVLIINNINMIKNHYDDPAIFVFIQQLLAVNAFDSAKKLIDAVTIQGDTSLTIHANYLLAEFYFQRQQWQKIIENLNSDINYLEKDQYHHALLMRGIAYQHISEHYLAIQEYEKIPSNSLYNSSAQLNLAIANLRQGWWTDGHIIIEALLKKQKKSPHEATLNRLYVTLAYSLFNQGYYRNARTTFQQIGVNSQYANQAILGIALTAAAQGDDIGALSATRYLKQQQQDELPVYESYLLMPFFYEKSNQVIAASTGYNEAIDYYQSNIARLQNQLNSRLDFSQQRINAQTGFRLNLGQSSFDFSDDYPEYFFKNRELLNTYSSYMSELNLQDEHNKLAQAYQQLTTKMGQQILQRKIDNLTSYLNQCRYGLARLFDNTTAK